MYEGILDILKAKTAQEREKAYRILERSGMDRMTATLLAKEMLKEMRGAKNG